MMEKMRVIVKGKHDPAWWVREVLGVELFPEQERLMREFYRSRYNPIYGENKEVVNQVKQLIIAAGMRSGKTALASVIGCYEFWDGITIEPNPADYYGLLKNQKLFIQIVATSSKQAEDGVYSNIQNMLEACEWMNTWYDIDILNDSIECVEKKIKLQILSSWATTAVGRTSKCVIFDELANFEDTSGKRGAWEIWSRLKKSTDTLGSDGHVIAISSLRHPTDIMMTLYNEGQQHAKDCVKRGRYPKIISILKPTWEMNPNFSEADLREEYKDDMPTFYRDYACQPQAAGGLEFPEGVRMVPMVNVLANKVYPTDPATRVLSIDPAVKNDSFGLACGYKDVYGHIIIDGLLKFTNTDGGSFIRPSEVWAAIAEAIPRLNIGAFVFDTWMFPDIIEKVNNQFGIEPTKHIVGKADYDMWRSMQDGSGERDIALFVIEDNYLEKEVNNLINVGNNRVDHPFNGSKDVADCVANCIWYLTNFDLASMSSNVMCIGVY